MELVLPSAVGEFLPHYTGWRLVEFLDPQTVWQYLWPLLVHWQERQLSRIVTCESPSHMTHTRAAGGMSSVWYRKRNCLLFRLVDDKKKEPKSSIRVHQQLQSHMNTYKSSFPQSASLGCGTWRTLHTFILSRLLITGERHASCDWILSPTQGCSDSPCVSLLNHTKQMKKHFLANEQGKQRERKRERLGERKNRTRNTVSGE